MTGRSARPLARSPACPACPTRPLVPLFLLFLESLCFAKRVRFALAVGVELFNDVQLVELSISLRLFGQCTLNVSLPTAWKEICGPLLVPYASPSMALVTCTIILKYVLHTAHLRCQRVETHAGRHIRRQGVGNFRKRESTERTCRQLASTWPEICYEKHVLDTLACS